MPVFFYRFNKYWQHGDMRLCIRTLSRHYDRKCSIMNCLSHYQVLAPEPARYLIWYMAKSGSGSFLKTESSTCLFYRLSNRYQYQNHHHHCVSPVIISPWQVSTLSLNTKSTVIWPLWLTLSNLICTNTCWASLTEHVSPELKTTLKYI